LRRNKHAIEKEEVQIPTALPRRREERKTPKESYAETHKHPEDLGETKKRKWIMASLILRKRIPSKAENMKSKFLRSGLIRKTQETEQSRHRHRCGKRKFRVRNRGRETSNNRIQMGKNMGKRIQDKVSFLKRMITDVPIGGKPHGDEDPGVVSGGGVRMLPLAKGSDPERKDRKTVAGVTDGL